MNDILKQLLKISSENVESIRPKMPELQILAISFAGLFYIVFVAAAYLTKDMSKVQWPLAVSMLSFIAFTLLYFVQVLFIIVKPVEEYSRQLSKTIEYENIHINSIISFCTNDLERTKKRLGIEINQMRSRSTLYLGSIEKLGIAPAIASLYFVYVKPIESIKTSAWIENEKWTAYVGAIVIGLYVGSLFMKRVISKYEQYIHIIEMAINVRDKGDIEQSNEVAT